MNHIELYPNQIKEVNIKDDTYQFSCENGLKMSVRIISPDIIRFRYAVEGLFPDDFSYALNKKFQPESGQHKLIEEELDYKIQTETTQIIIRKSDANTTICDLSGHVILQDEKGFHWEDNYAQGGHIVKMSKIAQHGESFYGLGDKPMHLNLRGKRLQNWGSDVYGFAKDQDPLYKNIPFYLGMHKGKGYGIFFDNTFRSYFDFASERKSVASFWANGGEMNYYFINGPKLMDVSARYTLLTGTPDLPPLWALGFHQCKWSYYPEKEVKEITQKFRDLKLPCDAIYLDIDYMDGFRCFTWDKEKFPKPSKMIAELKKEGFKTIVIIDPGIKLDHNYWVFKEGLQKNMFCRRADGAHMKGKVWPGDCYFPDFTNPKVRKWWADLFEGLIAENDVRGVWNDMNEPALFEVESKTFPDDVRHDFDGHPCSHRKAHNVYGMQMARATYKGVKKFTKANNQRPFVITRSAYAGTQKYTSAWTGDNIATWEHLWVANVQVQRMNVSGFGFCGSDVGGFTEHPTPELFVRWIQLAAFHPFFRVHSSGDHGHQEPWTFGETALNITRKFLELRYQLLPYIYTTFYQYTEYGYPMIRPLAFIDQEDEETIHRVDEFMLGDNLLICPVLEANSSGRYIYLPKGEWVNYWTDEVISGGKELWFSSDLNSIPVFVKPGSVICLYPTQQYVGEIEIKEVDLHIYYTEGMMTNQLYEDSGDGYDNERGVYNLRRFEVLGSNNSVEVNQVSKGHFEATYDTYNIKLHSIPNPIKAIFVNDREIELDDVEVNNGVASFKIPRRFLSIKVELETK